MASVHDQPRASRGQLSTHRTQNRGGFSASGVDREANAVAYGQHALQKKYSRPTAFTEPSFSADDGTQNRLNGAAPYPAKYNVDTALKERIAVQGELNRQAANVNPYTAIPHSQETVDYILSQKKLHELEQYDAYVNAEFNPRIPGNAARIKDIAPGFLNRRISQMVDDFDGAFRAQAIDFFGVNTKDDFEFQYARDQGLIQVPGLYFLESPADAENYEPGRWSPLYQKYMDKAFGTRENVPFSNVLYGQRNSGTLGRSRPNEEGGISQLVRHAVYGDTPIRDLDDKYPFGRDGWLTSQGKNMREERTAVDRNDGEQSMLRFGTAQNRVAASNRLLGRGTEAAP